MANPEYGMQGFFNFDPISGEINGGGAVPVERDGTPDNWLQKIQGDSFGECPDDQSIGD